MIGGHFSDHIYSAIKTAKDSCGDDKEAISALTKLYGETKVFMKSTLVAHGLKRPSPDKVFLEVKKDGIPVLIPDSNAIGIVLQHNITKEPSLNELEDLLQTKVLR